MLQVVDIYTKIIIAFLGFIAPTVTLLLPILGERIYKLKSTYESEERQLQTLIDDIEKPEREQVLTGQLPENLRASFNAFLRQKAFEEAVRLRKKLDDVEKDIKILDIKKTIKYVFLNLLLSLGFVMVYHLIKIKLYNCFGLHEKYQLFAGLSCLLISGIIFAIAVLKIWKLVSLIIETKSEISVITAETNKINN